MGRSRDHRGGSSGWTRNGDASARDDFGSQGRSRLDCCRLYISTSFNVCETARAHASRLSDNTDWTRVHIKRDSRVSLFLSLPEISGNLYEGISRCSEATGDGRSAGGREREREREKETSSSSSPPLAAIYDGREGDNTTTESRCCSH